MSDYSRYVVGAAAHSCPLAVGQISWQHFEEGGGGVNERLHRSIFCRREGCKALFTGALARCVRFVTPRCKELFTGELARCVRSAIPVYQVCNTEV